MTHQKPNNDQDAGNAEAPGNQILHLCLLSIFIFAVKTATQSSVSQARNRPSLRGHNLGAFVWWFDVCDFKRVTFCVHWTGKCTLDRRTNPLRLRIRPSGLKTPEVG